MKKTTPVIREISSKYPTVGGEYIIYRSIRRKSYCIHFSEIIKVRRQWNNIFKVLKKITQNFTQKMLF